MAQRAVLPARTLCFFVLTTAGAKVGALRWFVVGGVREHVHAFVENVFATMPTVGHGEVVVSPRLSSCWVSAARLSVGHNRDRCRLAANEWAT